MFATDCKKDLPPRGLEFLRAVCAAVSVPLYAIGGISAENIAAAIKELTAAKGGERELMGFRGKSFAKLHLPDSFSKAYRTAIDNFVKQKEI